jgi:simple sugar transport system ATP-binding protein
MNSANEMTISPPPAVQLENISKSFGEIQANKNINLSIEPGRVKALLGENGAGKSTLMNVLAGRFEPDSGRILMDGRPVRIRSHKEAINAGIGMVYQHFMLVPRMSVAENVLLGQQKKAVMGPAEMESLVCELAGNFGLDMDPGRKVSELSMGERQRVEILKLLYRQSRVLIFDEPTTVLTPGETEQLFQAFRSMTSQGKAVVFISHKLDEVMKIADSVAILRRGEIVDEMERNEIVSRQELASRMVGREVVFTVEKSAAKLKESVLEIDGLSGNGLKNVSLELKKGEIVAVVGVAGNGQKSLVRTVTGMSPPAEGRVRLLGRDWQDFFRNPPWERSLAYIPEDRLGMAVCPGLDMIDNILLTTRKGFTRGPILHKREAEKIARGLFRRFHVQPKDPRTRAWQLSGGNLQKLVLAREFFRRPQIIVAEQPSQGLDVGATEEIWQRLLNARGQAGVLLVTGDLNEALRIADTIAVMFRGTFMDVFPASDKVKVDTIGPLMAGIAPGA